MMKKTLKEFSTFTLLGIVIIVAIVIFSYTSIKDAYYTKIAKEEIASRESQNLNYKAPQSNTPTPSEKRAEFASSIKNSLNAPGLPNMCENAYFNDLGELIIEVNSEWITLHKGVKEDIIYGLEEKLREKKSALHVEGYGQFFSTSGKPLESFYAN